MTRLNPWALLGVQPGQSLDELKTAYKRTMLACHPDRGGDEQQAKLVNLAYQILTEKAVDGCVPGPQHFPKTQPPRPRPPAHVVTFVINSPGSYWTNTGTTTTGSWSYKTYGF